MEKMNTQTASEIENFIATIDRNEHKMIHVINANYDAKKYGWNKNILKEILQRIDKIYEKR